MPIRYLVTCDDGSLEPFLTPWFDPENHFNEAVGMVVFDLQKLIYTKDGKTWQPIQEDHL